MNINKIKKLVREAIQPLIKDTSKDLTSPEAMDLLRRVKELDADQYTRYASLIKNRGYHFALDTLKAKYGDNVLAPDYFSQVKMLKKRNNIHKKLSNMMVTEKGLEEIFDRIGEELHIHDSRYISNLDKVNTLKGLRSFPLEEIYFKVSNSKMNEYYSFKIINKISNYTHRGLDSYVDGSLNGVHSADYEVSGPSRPGEMKEAVISVINNLIHHHEDSEELEKVVQADSFKEEVEVKPNVIKLKFVNQKDLTKEAKTFEKLKEIFELVKTKLKSNPEILSKNNSLFSMTDNIGDIYNFSYVGRDKKGVCLIKFIPSAK